MEFEQIGINLNTIQPLQGFLRRCRDPIRVPRIANRVPAIRENHHQVPRIKETRVPIIRETTGSHRYSNIFHKKNPEPLHLKLHTFRSIWANSNSLDHIWVIERASFKFGYS